VSRQAKLVPSVLPACLPAYRFGVAGLEKRVRSLVDGYRELNELVEQAPARVSHAASEYVEALGLRPRDPPLSAEAIGGEGDGPGQASAFFAIGWHRQEK